MIEKGDSNGCPSTPVQQPRQTVFALASMSSPTPTPTPASNGTDASHKTVSAGAAFGYFVLAIFAMIGAYVMCIVVLEVVPGKLGMYLRRVFHPRRNMAAAPEEIPLDIPTDLPPPYESRSTHARRVQGRQRSASAASMTATVASSVTAVEPVQERRRSGSAVPSHTAVERAEERQRSGSAASSHTAVEPVQDGQRSGSAASSHTTVEPVQEGQRSGSAASSHTVVEPVQEEQRSGSAASLHTNVEPEEAEQNRL